MSSQGKNKIKFFLLFLVMIAVASYFLFNRYGVLKYLELKREQNKIKNDIEQVEKGNRLLSKRIDSLKSIDFSIEKIAREKYNLKRKGEKVIKIKEVD